MLVIGGRVAWLRAHRAARTIASTTCPFFGPPRVTMVSDMQPWDTMPTRAHEDVHVAQCRELGPIKYRVRNLSAAGKLSLEAPAFCAAAAARMKVDADTAYSTDRLYTDMIEGLSEIADSVTIKRSVMAACPEIASLPRRTMPRRRR